MVPVTLNEITKDKIREQPAACWKAWRPRRTAGWTSAGVATIIDAIKNDMERKSCTVLMGEYGLRDLSMTVLAIIEGGSGV
jgi:hypothetical protein